MTAWDFAALWSRIAAVQPRRPALLHGDTALSWAEFDRAAAAVAAALHEAGVRRGDIAALCLPNTPEHLICLAGCLRSGITPANVNPRYQVPELGALLDVLQPAAVFFDAPHTDAFAELRTRGPATALWCRTGTAGTEGWSRPLADLLADLTGPAPTPTSEPTDLILKCTGGTTGIPTPVRWTVGTLFEHLNDRNPWARHDTSRPLNRASLPALVDARLAVAGPLAHGSAMTRALGALCAGGAVITTPAARYDPRAVLDSVELHAADTLAIVGDAHARPLAAALAEQPGRWDLTDLRTITSSGATWTAWVKTALLDQVPHLVLTESLGSTEATGLGSVTATRGHVPPTGVFTLGQHARVLTANGAPARAGTIGRVGVSHPHPTGVHPTGDLPADKYLHADGATYLLSGDHVRLLDARHFAFLGRDADCINTGGEKVYAPEVAEVLATHPAVADVAVLGIPDPRLGHAVAALLTLRHGDADTDTDTDTDTVLAHARSQLAGYKIPRTVRLVDTIPRTPAGKIDLVAARTLLSPGARTPANPPAAR